MWTGKRSSCRNSRATLKDFCFYPESNRKIKSVINRAEVPPERDPLEYWLAPLFNGSKETS